MKDAKPVKHGGYRIAIILEPICDLRLDDEQCSLELAQTADPSQGLFRRSEIMDAVADGNQVEAWLTLSSRSCQKVDPVGHPSRDRSRVGLPNGFGVSIQSNNRGVRKLLGEGHANPTGAASDIENASALL